MKEKIIQNKGAKYSEMLISIVEKFDDELPAELSFQDTLQIGIEVWNLANNKDYLEKNNLYKEELKNHKYPETIEKMVSYKLEKFADFNNIIVDFSLENNILQVKTKTFENYFNSLFKNIILTNPKSWKVLKRKKVM